MSGTLKFLTGVVVGAVAGGVVGVLLAPDSGRKTRKKISKEVGKIKDEIVDTTEKKFLEIKKELNEKVGTYVDVAKDKINKIGNTATTKN